MSDNSVAMDIDNTQAELSRPKAGSWWRRLFNTQAFAVQVVGITLLMGAALAGYARWQTGSSNLVWPWLNGQRLLFAETQIDLGNVEQQEIMERKIRVANLSSEPLTLLGSQKSCGCIAIDEFPIAPAGEDYQLQLKIGTSNKPGPFEHTIKFFTDESGYTSEIVTVKGVVVK